MTLVYGTLCPNVRRLKVNRSKNNLITKLLENVKQDQYILFLKQLRLLVFLTNRREITGFENFDLQVNHVGVLYISALFLLDRIDKCPPLPLYLLLLHHYNIAQFVVIKALYVVLTV